MSLWYHAKIYQLITLYDGGLYHIETSLLICPVNQWTGFSMIGISVMKGIMKWGNNEEILTRKSYQFNPLLHCYTPWKHQKKRFSDVFREYSTATLGWNLLTFLRKRIIEILLPLDLNGEQHCVKSARIRSFSGPYFPAIGLNTERYPVSLCSVQVQKNADQKNFEYGHFLRSAMK